MLLYATKFFFSEVKCHNSFLNNKISQAIIYLQTLFKYPYCMRSSNYQCVNCEIQFEKEQQYIAHYRSQHHRYNIKRKLINLPPLSQKDFLIQFEDDKTSKQSSHVEVYCEICCKKFMSSGTYKQHLNSKKHKLNREKIKAPEKTIMSKSSSSSDFSIIGAVKAEPCIFCLENSVSEHLKNQHNFPPFLQECINPKGLTEYVSKKIMQGVCVYCNSKFNSEESVRQHMKDVGHEKLNIDNFNEYEPFYLWKISESSSEEQQQIGIEEITQSESSVYQDLRHPTLEQLQQRRMQKISLTSTGAIINGKEVGYRSYRNYYKQYIGRHLENQKLKYQPAIEGNKDSWKLNSHNGYSDRPPKIDQIVNFR